MSGRRLFLRLAPVALLVALAAFVAQHSTVGPPRAEAPIVADAARPSPDPPRGARGREAPVPAEQTARSSELAAGVRRAVMNACARAARESGGRVDASRVAVAVHVVELGSGAEVVARQADLPLRPASSAKLLTTAAALVLLGPTWELITPFEAAGPFRGSVLDGDLVVRAAGDPLYDADAEGAVAHLLAPLVEQLVEGGLTEVAGDLVLDEGSFAPPAPAAGWPDASQHWDDYCALAGGFSANGGCLTATVISTAAGRAAEVRLRPSPCGLRTVLEVETVSKGRLSVNVGANRDRALVRGRIPKSVSRWSDSFAHPDPVLLFGHALLGALERGGIRVRGGLRRERGAAGGPVLARLCSPLSDLLVPINSHSMNSVADQLFLATGQAVEGAGTREAAARATARALGQLGASAEGLVQIGGSGLSRENRVTARQLTALLAGVWELGGETAEAFLDSLAVAGESGTLEKRMRDSPARGRVRAKTGFIEGTSALSGFAESLGGRRYAFSILVSYPAHGGLNTSCWKPMGDEICERIVTGG